MSLQAPPLFELPPLIQGATMIHVQDFEMLCQILQVRELPRKVERECKLWTRLYHSNGGNGPLGVIHLITLLRTLKILIPDVEEDIPATIDWGLYPQDGSVRVEARFGGTWAPGLFVGFVESGTLAVRIDHDAMIRECRADMVRFSVAPLPVEVDVDTPPPAMSEMQEAAPVVPDITIDMTGEADEALDPEPLEADADQVGSHVWVETKDDFILGTITRVNEDKSLLVKFKDGHEDTVQIENIVKA